MFEVLTTESEAWLRAADKVGVELPTELQTARQRMEKAKAELAKLPAPLPVSTPHELVAAGVELARAQDEAERMASEAARLEELRSIGASGADGARMVVNRTMGQYGDELILALRPIVTALVDSARPHAVVLAEFAPGYGAGDIVHQGQPKHLKAFQAVVEIERRFGTCMAAWRASFTEGARRSGLDLREVKPVHQFWASPERVRDESLNGTKLNRRGYPVTIQPTVLCVASEDEAAGFRLASVAEMIEIFAAMSQGHADHVRKFRIVSI